MKNNLLLLLTLFLSLKTTAQFSPPTELFYPVGDLRYAFASDVDGDDDKDVVCASKSHLFWVPQTSPGVFGWPVLIEEVSIDFRRLAAGDVDGDGDQDLLYCDGNGIFGLYRNTGGGQFAPKVQIYDAPVAAWDLTLTDLDGDGDLDLLGAVQNQALWFANNGNGNFGPAQSISTAHVNLVDIHAEDLDGDGDLDVLAASQSDNKLAWYENLGGGVFGPQQLVAPAFVSCRTVASGDLDGDGLPDLLANNGNTATSQLFWSRNLGNGNFAPPDTLAKLGFHTYVTVTDMDGDGDLDVVSCYGLDQIGWFENDGTGQFGPVNEFAEGIVHSNYVQTDDLDGDGLPDPMYWPFTYAKGTLFWRASQGGGSLSGPDFLAIGIRDSYSFAIADFDQDGFDDIAVPSYGADAIVWYRYENGHFAPPKLLAWKYNLNPTKVAVADMNGDGFPDIVAQSTISPTSATYIGWYANNGDGSFTPQPSVIANSLEIKDLKMADVDNDGDWDILWVNRSFNQNPDGSLNWIENLGNGVLAASKVIASNLVLPQEVVAIKYDELNPPVIFLFKKGPGAIQRFEYLGNGQFLPGNFNGFSFGLWAEALDVNQDGLDDLVAVDWTAPVFRLTLWINLGNGFFGPQQDLDISNTEWYDPALGDINLDGIPDLVVGTRNTEVQWFQGLGGGNFAAPQLIPNSTVAAFSVLLPDLDKDGDLDLIALKNGYYANLPDDALTLSWNLANNESMSGRVFFDENENGTLDAGESFAGRFPVKVTPSALAVFTDENGVFNIYAGAGTYTITPDLGDCWELTTQPAAHVVSFNGVDAQSGFDFGVKTNNALTSGAISMTSSATRCGFTVPFWLNFSNNGCNAANGRAALVQHPLATFLSADIAPSSASGDTLFWDFNGLLPGENRQVKMEFEIAGVQFLGETIGMPLLVQDGNGQTVASYQYLSVINCAYDPNDKQVYPRRSENPLFGTNLTLFDERLEYTIRFQNTGTDTAFNIVIRDTLSVDLDWATFLPGSASHPFEATLHDDGLLEFHFRDIMLPDSNINEPGSHGYVNFIILTKPGLDENTVIENEAGIYFDFNPPIVTNTVSSTMVETLPNFTPAAAFDFTLTTLTAQFNDLSTNSPTSWFWDFGDGSTSTEQHPAHTYATPGDYTVCLTATNDWGSNQTCQPVMILTGTKELAGATAGIFVYPNPVQQVLFIEKTTPQPLQATLSAVTGQVVLSLVLTEKMTTVDVSGLPAGVWFLKTADGSAVRVVKM